MSGADGIGQGLGTACNEVNIGGTTELIGDPEIRPEKPYTIILFPGGHVEIARTTDDRYWVHVAVRPDIDDGKLKPGKIISARVDFEGRYGDEANATLRREIEAGDVNHIAFLIEPASPGKEQ